MYQGYLLFFLLHNKHIDVENYAWGCGQLHNTMLLMAVYLFLAVSVFLGCGEYYVR